MFNNFNDMRHLTDQLTNFDHSITLIELMSLDNARSSIEHRLLSLELRKPKMQDLDYLLETCRIAALLFLNRAFHGYWPCCPIITQLKRQLKEFLLARESQIIHEVHSQVHRGYYTWVLFIGGIHSQKDEDIAFFAKRIALAIQAWKVEDSGGWPEILSRIKRVAWTNALQSTACEYFGKQVERFIRSGDCVGDITLEKSAHACWPVEIDPHPTLPTA